MSTPIEILQQCDNNPTYCFTLMHIARDDIEAVVKHSLSPRKCFEYLKQHNDMLASEEYSNLSPPCADIVSYRTMEFMVILVADEGGVDYDDVDVKSISSCMDTLYSQAMKRDCFFLGLEFSFTFYVADG